ncbi:CDP-glycerol glycerophosphotransferase family protein [Vagococcus silagei]|nr:CDP-glycerol glycerophosphotransferase family protein [Vagococcus silagei]
MKHYLLSLAKTGYDWLVKLFSLGKTTTNPQKVTYLLSFPNNDHGLIRELNQKYDLTVCYTKDLTDEATGLALLGIKTQPIFGISGLKKTVKAVRTSRWCLADNYFAFLGAIKKPEGLAIIQLWHATGAIKTFGYEDASVASRSTSDKHRFNRVYASFDAVVVASPRMGQIFERSYGIHPEKLWSLGFPRTDHLVLEKETAVPIVKTKKRILYLPTYRDYDLEEYPLDLAVLSERLSAEYELWIKEHPASHWPKPDQDDGGFVHLVETATSADDLLLAADVLITDYSSVAFDYSLIQPEGQLIFYWFDEARYRTQPGLQKGIETELSSMIAYHTEEVLAMIQNTEQTDLSEFNQIWNTYNDGNATMRLLNKMDGA